MERGRQCRRCLKTFPESCFKTSTARGYKVIRSYCDPCLAAYYREYKRKWRARQKAGK